LKKDNTWGLLEVKDSKTAHCEWNLIVDYIYDDIDFMLNLMKVEKLNDNSEKMEIKQIVDQSIQKFKVKLSKSNLEFWEYIKNPLGFNGSIPDTSKKSAKEQKETHFQREIYKSDKNWYDFELPIGQKREPAKRWSSKRVDFIGFFDGRLVICELKYKKDSNGQPFDALLQLLSYYEMIIKNAKKLDEENIHHKNPEIHNKTFKWEEFHNKPVTLRLLANHEYWSNYEKATDKNKATREIINECSSIGLRIELQEFIGESAPFTYKFL
jgi:hypothetical protein